MMQSVLHNQSLFDIAVQQNGSVFSVIDWAIKNGISITDQLTPGQILEVPETTFKNERVADHFKNKSILIATANTPASENYELPEEFPLSF